MGAVMQPPGPDQPDEPDEYVPELEEADAPESDGDSPEGDAENVSDGYRPHNGSRPAQPRGVRR